MSNQFSTFQAEPPSMPAGSHEMRDYYSNQEPTRSLPHTAPSITPYLGLRARLSQIWINRWTILLLLVLARTLIAISGINNDLASARREALSACSGVESIGSAMASMPHYMSQGLNEMTATGVEKAVNGLTQMTTLSVTGVEEIVVFVVDMMTSTYTCLITLAVTGSLHVALQVAEGAQGALNTSIQAIGKDMANTVNTFETAYNEFVKSLNTVSSVLNSPITAPQLDLSNDLNSLNNLQLPTSYTPALENIDKNLPSFAQVQNFTNNVIRLPFEEVKSLISSNLGTYTFDRSIFPTPQKQQLTFCSDNNGINEFFDDLVKLAAFARKIFIGVLLAAAILVCIPMAWREIKRWRTMQERSQLVRSAAHDPMDVVYIVSRPYTSTAGIRVANHFQQSRRQILTRWVFSYATSDAALFVLCLALAGLFSAACQAILLKCLEKEIPNLTNQVGAFADKVVNSLNNASEQWATESNHAVSTLNADINNQMLGWVNITTHALNDTLNTFVDDTVDVLNQTFGGTVLYQPIMDVLQCLVLMKVTGIEKALTWISDNAHVEFPTLPNNTFSLGAVDSILSGDGTASSDSFLTASSTQASDDISAAVLRVTNALEDAIRTEALVATAVLLIWVLIVLIGVIRALTLWFGRDKTRGEGGMMTEYPSTTTTTVHNPAGASFPQRGVPLDTIHIHAQAHPATPAPKYSTTIARRDVKFDPFSSTEDDEDEHGDDGYEDQKLGFADRQLDHYRQASVVSRQQPTIVTTTTRGDKNDDNERGRGRVVSSKAEVWGRL